MLQLRDELARRGLKRAGTKTDLIERLVKSEEQPPVVEAPTQAPAAEGAKQRLVTMIKAQMPTPPPVEVVNTEEELPEPHLNSLSKSFLWAEIMKRRSKDVLSPDSSKKKLVDTLQQLIKKERIDLGTVKDVRSLMMKINSGRMEEQFEDVLTVLRGVVDIDTIPQNDFNVLVNSDNSSFFKLWRLIYSSAPTLSVSALDTVLKTMHLFRFTLKKNCSSGTIKDDTAGVASICNRLMALQGEMTLPELASAIQILSQFTQAEEVKQTIFNLQSTLMSQLDRREIALSALSANTLVSIFESLPWKAYDKQQVAVERLLETIFTEKKVKLSQSNTLSFFNTLVKTNAPVPNSVLVRLSELNRDMIRRFTSSQHIRLFKNLCEKRALTEQSARLIFESMSNISHYDQGLYSYREIIRLMKHHNYLPILLKRSLPFSRIINLEDKLNIAAVLDLCNTMCPYLENDRLIHITLQAINRANHEDWNVDIHLKPADSLLRTVLQTLPEKPLYNYQYLSFSTFDLAARKELCHALAKLLMTNMRNVWPGLLAYMASPLCTKIPENLNWTSPSRKDATYYFLALRKFVKSVPDYAEKVLSLMKEVSVSSPTFEELFHAAEFCQLEVSATEMNTFTLQKFIHQTVIKMVNDIHTDTKKAEFVMPTLFTLGIQAEKGSEMYDTIMKYVLPRLHFRSLYGQLLQLNLIYVCRTLKEPQFVLDGIPNLTFLPRDQTLAPSLVRTLLCTLSELQRVLSFDMQHVIPLVTTYSSYLDDETISKSRDILEAISEHLTPEVSRKVQKKITEDFDVSISELSILRKHRILKHSTLKHALSMLNAATERSAVLSLIESLLEYGAVVGNTINLLPVLIDKIERFELWNELRLKAITNLLFLHLDLKDVSVRPQLLQLFVEKTALKAQEQDEFVENPVNGLKCYLPFNHNSVFEPRKVVSDLKENLVISSQGIPSLQDLGDEDLSQRLNAVMRGFKLPSPVESSKAIKPRSSPSSNPDFHEFVKLMPKSFKSEILYTDPTTQWTIDIAVPKAKLAIMFYDKNDLLGNENGRGSATTLIMKVMKAQLMENGWRVVGVTRYTWDSMTYKEKEFLVKQICVKVDN